MKYIAFTILFLGLLFFQTTPLLGQPDTNANQYLLEGQENERKGEYTEALKRYFLAYDFGNEQIKKKALDLIKGVGDKQTRVIVDRNIAVAALKEEKIKVENERNEKEIQRKKAVENANLARQKGIQVEALRLPLLADSLRQMGHPDALKIAFLGLKLNENSEAPASWKAFTTAIMNDEAYREILGTSVVKIDDAQLLPNQEKLLIQSDNRLEILDWTTQKRTLVADKVASFFRPIITKNGDFIAFQTDEKTVEVWETQVAKTLITIRHTAPIRVLRFSKNGQFLLSSGRDQTIALFEMATKEKNDFAGHQGSIYDLQMAEDNLHFLSRSSDGTVRLWHRKTKAATILGDEEIYVYDAQFSPTNEQIVTSSITGKIKVWDKEGERHFVLPIQEKRTRKIYFFPDGQHFLTQSNRATHLWNKEGELVRSLPECLPKAVQIDSEGKQFLTWNEQNVATLFDKKGEAKATFKGHEDVIVTAHFSPNGQHILTTAKDGTAKLWTIQGNLLTTWNLQSFQPVPAFFAPDGEAVFVTEANAIQRYPMPEVVYQKLSAEEKNIVDYLKQQEEYNIQFFEKTKGR